jgi:hypothetical protein
MDMHRPVEVVKTSVAKQARRIVHIGNSHITSVAKEYCHLVYFGGVFFEGHGIYSYAGGFLLVFCALGLVTGSADGE